MLDSYWSKHDANNPILATSEIKGKVKHLFCIRWEHWIRFSWLSIQQTLIRDWISETSSSYWSRYWKLIYVPFKLGCYSHSNGRQYLWSQMNLGNGEIIEIIFCQQWKWRHIMYTIVSSTYTGEVSVLWDKKKNTIRFKIISVQ